MYCTSFVLYWGIRTIFAEVGVAIFARVPLENASK